MVPPTHSRGVAAWERPNREERKQLKVKERGGVTVLKCGRRRQFIDIRAKRDCQRATGMARQRPRGDATAEEAERFVRWVSSRSQGKAGEERMFSGQRQRQFPLAVPGTFMRVPAPRSRRSWTGAIVRAAMDDHARRISSGAASALPPGVRLR